MTAAETVLSNYVSILCNYKDFDKNHIRTVEMLQKLIGWREDRLPSIKLQLERTKSAEQRDIYEQKIKTLETELTLFRGVLSQFLTMVDFHFRGSGTRELLIEIEKRDNTIELQGQLISTLRSHDHTMTDILRNMNKTMSDIVGQPKVKDILTQKFKQENA